MEALELPDLDLSTATDQEFIDVVNKIMAPADKGGAMTALKRLKMTDVSANAFNRFSAKFAHEVKNFPADLKPDEEQIIKCFVNKLQPAKLRARVVEQGCKTFYDVLIFSIRESRTFSKYGLWNESSEKKNTQPKPGRNARAQRSSYPQSQHSASSDPAQGASTIKCVVCNGLGHRARDCPKSRQNRSKPHEVKLMKELPTRNSKKKLIIKDVIPVETKFPRVSFRVKGKKVEGNLTCLIDSGSDLNIIHPDIAAAFELAGDVAYPELTKFKTASGKVHSAKKKIKLTAVPLSGTWKPVYLDTVFVIWNCDENVLLSHKWLQKQGLKDLSPESDSQMHVAQSGIQYLEDDIEYSMKSRHEETFINDDDLEEFRKAILRRHLELFEEPNGPAKVPEFSLELIQDQDLLKTLPRVKPGRYNTAKNAAFRAQLDELLKLGYIAESTSSIASRPLLVMKKDGQYRMVVDFRDVNRCTKSIRYPLPNGKDIMARMNGSKFFARLDLRKGFHQIPMDSKSRHLTAFMTPFGLFEYVTMPFGLKNPSGFLQKTLEDIFHDLIGVEVFIDDIVIHGKTKQEYKSRLDTCMTRLKRHRFRLNKQKCAFNLSSVEYLGHIVSADGIAMSPSKKVAVLDLTPPKSCKDVRSFLGFVNYFREFIPNYAEIASPLHKISSTKAVFKWTAQERDAWQNLKSAAANCVTLHFPSDEHLLVLRTDASNNGIGAHLFQVIDGKERTIAFFSRALGGAQKNWSTIEQEAYAIFASIKHFTHFLWGTQFLVETDHQNLVYIHRSEAPKIVRWRLAIQEYDFSIRHIKGKANEVADYLSRVPQSAEVKRIQAMLDDGSDAESCIQFMPTEVPFVPSEQPPPPAEPHPDDVIPSVAQSSAPQAESSSAEAEGSQPKRRRRALDRHVGELDTEDSSMSDASEEYDFVHPETHGPFAVPDPVPQVKLLQLLPVDQGDAPMPDDETLAAFNRSHNSVIGHHGVNETMRRMVALGQQAKDIRPRVVELVRSCAICQMTRTGNQGFVPTVRTTAVDEPFAHLEWDYLGPFKADSQGYCYVLAIMDRFTRFLELIPTKDQMAETSARGLLSICARYGTPRTIHSDNGTHFTAVVVSELCKLLAARQTLGPPHRPQAQGSIERANREILRHLRALMIGVLDFKDWSDQLPLVQRCCNAKVNSSTGYAPAQLLYGNAVDLDRMLLTAPPAEEPNSTTFHHYLQSLLASQDAIVEAARQRQLQVVEARLAKAPANPTFFEPHTYVLVRPKSENMPKHGVQWLGPYVVVRREHESYICQDILTNKIRTFTADRMKVYREDIQVPAPKVALWGHREYEVENIVSHTIGPTAAKCTFTVRWRGYGPEDDHTLKFSEVKNLACFRTYIRDHNLSTRLFPRKKFPLIE